jgi:hypothetical protein
MSTKSWGNITWKLFHTLAEQVHESKFPEVRDKLINIIISTCKNLPCPDCAEHATNTLKKSYPRNIKTKKHFIEFLRQLHNIVNIRLHKKTYTNEEIKNMYTNVNINQTINEFIKIYSKNNYSEKMLIHNFHKNMFLKEFTNKIISIRYAVGETPTPPHKGLRKV